MILLQKYSKFMKKYNDFITENNDNIVDAQIVDDNNENNDNIIADIDKKYQQFLITIRRFISKNLVFSKKSNK